MGVNSSSPSLAALRKDVEKKFGKMPEVHNDFMELAHSINETTKEYVSSSTLERVWKYSTRGYDTVSLHTLNLLSKFSGFQSWNDYREKLGERGLIDSDMFEGDSLNSDELSPGDIVELGWLPNRLCRIKYLGDNHFEALECENPTMRQGDTFICVKFMLGQPAIMDNFQRKGDAGTKLMRYVAGSKNGLQHLKLITHQN